MLETVLSSGRDILFVAVPSIAVLMICIFRLEQFFSAPKEPVGHHRAPCGEDENGELILSDPDGHVADAPRMRRPVAERGK